MSSTTGHDSVAGSSTPRNPSWWPDERHQTWASHRTQPWAEDRHQTWNSQRTHAWADERDQTWGATRGPPYPDERHQTWGTHREPPYTDDIRQTWGTQRGPPYTDERHQTWGTQRGPAWADDRHQTWGTQRPAWADEKHHTWGTQKTHPWADEKHQTWASGKSQPWVSEKQLYSMSSRSSMSKDSFGWKPTRRRGEPRTVAPPFWWSPKAWFRHELWSWRFYVWIYAALAGLVVLIHLIALAAVAGKHPFDDNGRATVTEGSCDRIIKTSRYAHWFTSVFGTGYLSASAYVMYCLTGPTRKEIEVAHAKNKWLDIGVLSLRNVFSVSRKRATFFLLLGLTSPLIQFFYNAMIFITYSANSYDVFVAQSTFTTNLNMNIELSQNATLAQELSAQYNSTILNLQAKAIAGQLQRLTPADCMDKYGVPLQYGQGNVVLIANLTTSSGNALIDELAVSKDPRKDVDVFDIYHALVPTEDASGDGEQYSWICDETTASNGSCLYDLANVKGNVRNWTISGNATVDHCLAETTDQHCKLQVSLSMSLICFCTITFKVIVMFAVAIFVNETPLMTTGDAIESFMKDPDPYTQGMCMASKKMIEMNPRTWPKYPLFVRLKKYRWAHGIKNRVGVFCLGMVIALCLNAALFCTVKDAITIPNFFSLGIGSIDRNFFIGWAHRDPKYFVQAVFLANVGHAVFGILYIIYNNVFYAMTFSWEWARYANHRKGLRVSEAPRGSQRTVYFFLMPLKLAVPIMLFSACIHTLVSNTLFLVDVETYGRDPTTNTFIRTPAFDFTTTGFSPLGNALLIVAGALMISYLLCCSALELKSTMPVTSTCSAAISAACQPDESEPDDFYLRKISWGVTGIRDGIGHCTFSCNPVDKPDEYTPYF